MRKVKPSNVNLSLKQAQVLRFVGEFRRKNAYSPSYQEIAEEFNVSVPTIHQHIQALKKKGFVDLQHQGKRSVKVVRNGTGSAKMSRNPLFGYVSVPVLGAANAGVATLFAEENTEGFLRTPKAIIGKRKSVFALRVEGDSMNRAKIKGKRLGEGDFVLIDPKNTDPRNGDYVLSIIDGVANLKKFHRDQKTGEISLISESSNKNHKPIYISSQDGFMVNGKIIDVIKK